MYSVVHPQYVPRGLGMPSQVTPSTVKFGPFELDRRNFELRRDGQAVKLDRTPLKLLFFLVENAGTLVTREQAVEHVWGAGVFIEAETSLYTAVRKIRRALDDDTGDPKFIQTISGRGYRFVAKVEEAAQYAAIPPSPSAAVVRRFSHSWALWTSVICAMLAAILLAWFGLRSSQPAKLMLIVLPLENLSGDPQQDYLVDGITEEIITELGSLDPKQLGVIARTSAMQYKNSKESVGQIARELGVGYVLEGSVRRSGNNVRVTAQLIQAADQTHVWAQSYDREIGDVLRMETDIATEVAGQIRLAVSGKAQERLAAAAKVKPEAHDAYLRGLQGWNQRNREGFEQAIREFSRATEIDPNYAPAFAGLARVYSLAPIFAGIPASEAAPKALEAANHALSLDETLADAHSALAFAKVHYVHDWTFAERDLRRAIELDPNNPYAHFFYSNSFLSPSSRHEEAIAEMKRAIELDPLSTRIQCFAGRTYIWARRYDDALSQFQRVNQLDPDFALNHERLAHLYAIVGKFNESIDEEAKARTLVGEKNESALQKADVVRQALAAHGVQGYWEAQLQLSQGVQNPPEAYTSPFGLAIIYSHLGEKAKAFANLEIAYGERDEEMTNLAIEPQFDLLRSDPRFRDLERRVGIPGR